MSAIMNYNTLKQKYQEYKDKRQLADQLIEEYGKKAEKNRLSSIAIMDELEELQLELTVLRDQLFDHLIESHLNSIMSWVDMKKGYNINNK